MGTSTIVISDERSLDDAVVRHRTEPSLTFLLEPDEALGPQQRDGWEIGVLTVLLGAGIPHTSIVGADERRIRRVQVVLECLAAARSTSTPVVTS